MTPDDAADPDMQAVFAAGVRRGAFATVEAAKADFDAGMLEANADIEAGRTKDIDVVWSKLRKRYASWPRAAAE
ncbi:MAG TPA: hypothetical protein VFQ57_08300 [Sphingomonas sp.]|jgi:hypothetical protein|nr:hypothetical protein [Sphingomonas sp.]